ncbi:uncharacterized protein JN550_002475 [Neoarthrinium moseri]|uniref:uncharacterized protein n=1 Tax=Neoarthrinium moseri TaxID=1658444 RepID=UPI001FDBD66F|nr:uncharacterized protein JN550_002475 [Neoarthrinium moseri]KAI1875046.1 hypothetical protein JN550_002475 [Neoarthrinium moseri]
MVLASAPVVLIFGAGANIGQALIKRFAEAGYRVAAVSRSGAEPPAITDGILSIRADLEETSAPTRVLGVVKDIYKATPKVFIYNAAHQTSAPDPNNVFSIGTQTLNNDLSIMVSAPWTVATAAFEAWSAEDKTDDEQRTFIYTGNCMPQTIIPIVHLATVGVGKSGAAYWVQLADALYGKKGFRFFFADERTAEGITIGPVPGAESHAQFYLTLAEGKSDIPSYATFVDGKYRKF